MLECSTIQLGQATFKKGSNGYLDFSYHTDIYQSYDDNFKRKCDNSYNLKVRRRSAAILKDFGVLEHDSVQMALVNFGFQQYFLFRIGLNVLILKETNYNPKEPEKINFEYPMYSDLIYASSFESLGTLEAITLMEIEKNYPEIFPFQKVEKCI